MTTTQTRRRTAFATATATWQDLAWPVLSGAATAVGVLSLWHLIGPLGIVLIVLGLWLLIGMTLYGVASESGMSVDTAVRIGLWGSVATVAMLGLVTLLPAAGWFVALAIAVTSPAVTDWFGPRLRRATDVLRRRRPTYRPDPGQAAVDRAFEEIVADLKKDA